MNKATDPRMHTAEHLLNQTMIQLIGTKRCFSAHIEKKKSKCDYHFTRDITEDESNSIESAINDIINKGLEVKEEYVDIDTAKKKFDLNRLPDVSVKEIRIIKIGDYDACPCIGSHVRSTKELDNFKITTHSFNDGVLRVRYKLPKEV